MNKHDNLRFWTAVAVSPAFPLTVLSLDMPNGWAPLIFFFGYLFAFLIALPIMAMLLEKTSFVRCLLAGGIAAIVPITLLSALSLFSGDAVLSLRMLRDLCQLFALGAGGGALFWAIAYWGVTPAAKAD